MNTHGLLRNTMVLFLKSTDKQSALRELLDEFSARNVITDVDSLYALFLERESLMSTGIGLGIGVPHIRTDAVDTAHVVVGISRAGIADYVSLDDQLVKLIFMIIVPTGGHKEYIKLLSHIATALKKESFRNELVAEQSREGVYNKLCMVL